jgi:hypothetical protein
MRFKLGGVEFTGDTLDAPLVVRNFEPGGADVRTQDTEQDMYDGVLPGMDLLGGRLWVWDLSARGDNLDDVLAANASLEAAWRTSSRLKPGVYVPLSYNINNRWRRVYGRPGRYSGIVPDHIAESGIGHLVCDFRVLKPAFYDDVENSVKLTIVPATTGGLEAPLASPLSTVRSSAPRAGIVTNTGDASTPLSVTFKGPITNPWVRSTAGLEIALLGTLAYDQSVTVDGMNLTVTRNTGSSASGMVTRKTNLRSSLLAPGTTEFSFGGTDSTGTATATLAWRNAYNSI